MTTALAEANRLWDGGDQSTAVTKYRSLPITDLLSKDRSLVLSRLIDFDCEHNNLGNAKALVEKALTSHIELQLTSAKAKGVLEAQRAELAKKEAEQKSRDGSGPLLPGQPAEVARKGKLVKVEISPNAAETISVKGFGWDGSGTLTFKMTFLPNDRSVSGTEPWSFSAWDAEGTKLMTDSIGFGNEIRTRETVKAETFVLPPETARVKIHLRGERP
jgi:hypothetical protein